MPPVIISRRSPYPICRRILITGAAGRIGSYFAEHSRKYELRLHVREYDERAEKLKAFGEVIVGDLEDPAFLLQCCQGMDAVLHLAGDPDPSAKWDDLLSANIIGTYNLFLAAKKAGCQKVIYASSIHAVSGYAPDIQVKTDDPVNPGDLYGVSKCFAESLSRYMAEKEGLPVIVLRIGACQPLENARKPENLRNMDAFLSLRDFQQLAELCIDDCYLQFGIFHALSDNKFKRLDISEARHHLGYAPQDDFFTENPIIDDAMAVPLRKHNVDDEAQKSGLRDS
jgi:NAD(P)-dependent dehydrogenase (short-subunit alcohol dehydrogenase family)